MKSRARTSLIVLSLVALASIAHPAGAATAPTLGTSGFYAVLGGSTVTNTGSTVINGDLGVSPGTAITGFGPGVVNPPGTIHAGDAHSQQAQSDLIAAYNGLAGQACNTDLTGQDLGGLTLTPGTYCFSSSAFMTGELTLNALGNPDSVFVFQIGSTLVTASNSSVTFINGTSCNLYWQVGSSATLGTQTDFAGTIVALTSITANTQATVQGRLLARDGAVTLDSNTVTRPLCGTPLVPTTTTVPPTTTTTVPPTTTTTVPPTTDPPSGTPIGTAVTPDRDIAPGSVVSPGAIVFPIDPSAAATSTSTPVSSANPSESGDSVTFTTIVKPTGSASGVSGGRVTFLDGSTVLGTVPVDNRGNATFTTSSLTSRDHSITAVFHGAPGYRGSISQVLVQKVRPSGGTAGDETRTITTTQEIVKTGINALPVGITGSTLILLGIGVLFEDHRRRRLAANPQQSPDGKFRIYI